MVEVFKTNVENLQDAVWILGQIGKLFPDYQANFDLEDCDRILRVKCNESQPDERSIIMLINSAGYQAAILEESSSESIPLEKG